MKTVQLGAETVHALKDILSFHGIPVAWTACGNGKEARRCDINEDESNTLPVSCKICLKSNWYRKEMNEPQTGGDART